MSKSQPSKKPSSDDEALRAKIAEVGRLARAALKRGERLLDPKMPAFDADAVLPAAPAPGPERRRVDPPSRN